MQDGGEVTTEEEYSGEEENEIFPLNDDDDEEEIAEREKRENLKSVKNGKRFRGKSIGLQTQPRHTFKLLYMAVKI